MYELIQRIEFWVAMVFAVLMKLRASPTLTRTNAIVTTASAITGALVFTEPAYAYFGVGGDSTKFAIAALVALTCEHIARLVLTLTFKDIMEIWRGKP